MEGRETTVAGSSNDIDSTSHSHERKHRRFNLHYPVVVRLPPENPLSALGNLQTTSRNISISGLLLDAPVSIPAQSRLSFTIVVQSTGAARPIVLESEGRVVRLEPQPDGRFAVAIECSRPLTEMESYWQN